MRSPSIILAVIVSAGLWAGCSDSATTSACTPGQSIACFAPGGCSGGQVCNASGTYDACVCSNDGGSDANDVGAVPGAPTGVTAAPVTVVTTVTTLAGSGANAFANGTGTAASFNHPFGVTIDASSNVYVADIFNNRIRKIAPTSVVTTLAGSGAGAFADGNGIGASFFNPTGVASDANGTVFIADWANQRIRKVSPAGVVTTLAGSGAGAFADGNGVAASFKEPRGVTVDPSGTVYVADKSNNRIRKISPAGVVTTLAGSGTAAFADGTGSVARFSGPEGVASDADGNVYVADAGNHRIRVVTSAGVVTTLAGSGNALFADGAGPAASFNYPSGVAVDSAGNLYVGDYLNHRIRRVTVAGVVTTLAGSGSGTFADGIDGAASFYLPAGIAVDDARNVYVADEQNHRIRKLLTVGIGRLTIAWAAPAAGGSAPTGYVAVARAPNRAAQTCSTSGATSCSIDALASGVAYQVTVTATNAVGASAPSGTVTASPN